jgi:hypothetical protein
MNRIQEKTEMKNPTPTEFLRLSNDLFDIEKKMNKYCFWMNSRRLHDDWPTEESKELYNKILDRCRNVSTSVQYVRNHVMYLSNSIASMSGDVSYHISHDSFVDPSVPTPPPQVPLINPTISVPTQPPVPPHLTPYLIQEMNARLKAFKEQTKNTKGGAEMWEGKAMAVKSLEDFLRENLAADPTFRFMNASDKTMCDYKIWWKQDDDAEWEEMSWYRLLKPTIRYASYLGLIQKDRDSFKKFLGELIDRSLYGQN